MRSLLLYLGIVVLCTGQTNGDHPYSRFSKWRQESANSGLKWEQAIENYSRRLKTEGLSDSDITKTISIISSHDEASLYDPIYKAAPKFETAPNRLLVEAIRNRRPGKALDVGMGQGRNTIYLAQRGWQVTGFDVSQAGLEEARKQAASSGITIQAVHASDEEFEFGTEQWDLIAILYPIEKRSVFRVRQALRKGGVVVVECAHKEGANDSYAYDTNELLKIFEGFRIVKYEDTVAMHEWARKELRMVKLIAEK